MQEHLSAPVSSWATSPAVRRNMQANRGRDTGPEVAVRRLIHAQGLRYRVNYRPDFMRRRSVDIAFTRPRLAVFIDGCFWHGCPEHFVAPKANAPYWIPKIEANKRRDASTDASLASEGWTVRRFWEHEDPAFVADQIRIALQAL